MLCFRYERGQSLEDKEADRPDAQSVMGDSHTRVESDRMLLQRLLRRSSCYGNGCVGSSKTVSYPSARKAEEPTISPVIFLLCRQPYAVTVPIPSRVSPSKGMHGARDVMTPYAKP